jgi:hypothetical protein
MIPIPMMGPRKNPILQPTLIGKMLGLSKTIEASAPSIAPAQ